MKVTQILYSGLGGHGSVVFSLIGADRRRKWSHHLIFYGVEDLLPDYKKTCEEYGISYSFVKKKRGLFNAQFLPLYRALKKEKPDAVILHSPAIVLLVWLYRIFNKTKLIAVEHTANNAKTKKEWLGSFLSCFMTKKIVYLSPGYQQQIRGKFRLINVMKRSVVIPNGIDLERFSITGKTAGTEIEIGMTGRFSILKNQRFFVETAIELLHRNVNERRLMFHLAGIGECYAEVKKQVESSVYKEHFILHGLLNEAQVIGLLARIDIYFHASYFETMCTSVMQAMACGLPVVGSNIAGVKEFVTEKNGFLIENDQLQATADILERLISSPETREKMGAAGRVFAEENFSSVTTFNKYDELIAS